MNAKRRQAGQKSIYHVVRTRTVLYAAIIVAVGAVMLYALATRRDEAVDIIHDRNPLFVRLSDGALRNGFNVRVLNKSLESKSFALKVSGLPGAHVEVIGSATHFGGYPVIKVGPDQSREVRVLVTVHRRLARQASIPLTFTIIPATDGTTASARDHFFLDREAAICARQALETTLPTAISLRRRRK